MKNITKLCCVALLGTCFVGCTDNFNDYNTNHYAIYQADPPVLIPEMIEPMMFVQQNSSQLIDQMVGALGGYMTCSNRWGGQNFDTFNASEGWNSQTFNKSYNKGNGKFIKGCSVDACMRLLWPYSL